MLLTVCLVYVVIFAIHFNLSGKILGNLFEFSKYLYSTRVFMGNTYTRTPIIVLGNTYTCTQGILFNTR